MSSSIEPKKHIVLVPVPLYGHINPMFKLAKLLHHYGFHITFVNTEFMHERVLESTIESLPPTFRFETIPDGLAANDHDSCEDDADKLFHSISISCLDPFRKLLAKLNDDMPPVSGIISDVVMEFTVEAGGELGIQVLVLWVIGAFSCFTSSKFGLLIEKGYLPLKVHESYLTNGYLDTVIEDVPELEGMRLRHLPSNMIFVNEIPYAMKLTSDSGDRIYKASGFICNTFDDLESSALQEMLSMTAPYPLYSIGPLHLLEKQVCDKDLEELGSNLWKEDTECLEWLDSKDPNSVIYVNFGTTGTVTRDKLIEFAWGLANSNQSFLWIVRPNLVRGEKAVLTKEFIECTKGRGMLASWCPQEKVLSHHSIGGFLTHSGWNSVLESICCGVPMICWPLIADQPTNCWTCCNQWGIGMELSDVKRDVVENFVRELLTGDEGKEMKKRAMEWKKAAHDSVKNSSLLNLEKMKSQLHLPVGKE